MINLLQALLSGLALGGIYALVALGFSITHTTTKTLNFGQGEFLVAGSLVAVGTLLLISGKSQSGVLSSADVTFLRYGVALLVSLAVLGLLGVILYFTAVRPFFGSAGMSWVMSTIGFGIILQNTALAIWGPGSMSMPSPLGESVIRIGGAGIRPQEILVLVVTAVVMLALDHVLRRTRIGKAVRAVAANRQAAALMGINVAAIVVLAFVVSSGLAGLAGLLIAPITTASVFMGLAIALKAFSAAIVGGLTSPRGCIAGGFLLGCIEALVGLWRAEMREITIFALIILVLVIKPEGLFGQKPFEKV
ncbi:branched-chain amino acid ABC transporter permease [Variovorax arabinosiphilus]|uniref:branched-chain amino acid ABC transporter permease n=1 Tax=Variovorax arabinosiphilus TaxID=3053498 RepID=UPI002574FCDE|nr:MULTISPECIES: branched-chain amino acid ABC transporter permease [unclassified Variovorax]MDM0122973.1 branched-chain amino acid ABC transporter permease [Variovorax sp. J2L1-78]MDM0132031.1 branched-chain amino acid ABC transporter permease [Variovorax sp. J2L1-63]MDM0235736.1 branched-chain amino acid ABC transporter permease [Variovorax sp. J2R1-6]